MTITLESSGHSSEKARALFDGVSKWIEPDSGGHNLTEGTFHLKYWGVGIAKMLWVSFVFLTHGLLFNTATNIDWKRS